MTTEVSTHHAASYVTFLSFFLFFLKCESSLDCAASLYFNLPLQEGLFVWKRTSEIIHHSKQKDNLCFISDPPCRVECCRISVWDYTPPSAPPVCFLTLAIITIISREKHPSLWKRSRHIQDCVLCTFSIWLWNISFFKRLQNEGV